MLCTKYMASSEAMTSSTHHLHNHIDVSRNLSRKFAKLQSVIPSLYFNRFSSSFTVLFESFTLSSEIKLNLFRISPLKNKWKTQWKPKWWATVSSIEIFTTCSRLHRLVGRSQTCLPPSWEDLAHWKNNGDTHPGQPNLWLGRTDSNLVRNAELRNKYGRGWM